MNTKVFATRDFDTETRTRCYISSIVMKYFFQSVKIETNLMIDNLIEDRVFKKLQFTQEWIEVGIINPKNFIKYKNKYLEGKDSCSEHYRYSAFKEFIQNNKSLSPEILYAIYNLGKNDPDLGMEKSMRINIVLRIDCPEKLIQMAIEDEDTSKTVLKLQKKGQVDIS